MVICKPEKKFSPGYKLRWKLDLAFSSLQKCEKVNLCHLSRQTLHPTFLKNNEIGKAFIIKNEVKQRKCTQMKNEKRDKTYCN